jgi:predicted transcriptional regulator
MIIRDARKIGRPVVRRFALDLRMPVAHIWRMLTRGAVLLRHVMKTLGLTQVATAERIGVDQSAVSHYLRAKIVPSRAVARVIQAELGIATGAWDELVGAAEKRAYFRVPKGAKRLMISGVLAPKKAASCRAAKRA